MEGGKEVLSKKKFEDELQAIQARGEANRRAFSGIAYSLLFEGKPASKATTHEITKAAEYLIQQGEGAGHELLRKLDAETRAAVKSRMDELWEMRAWWRGAQINHPLPAARKGIAISTP